MDMLERMVQYKVSEVEKNKKNFMTLSSVSVLVPLLRRSLFSPRHFTFVSGTSHLRALLEGTQKCASGVNSPAATHACNFHYMSALLLV